MGLRSWVNNWFQQCFRKKPISSLTEETKLKRCLGIMDLVFLGIGAMVDSGIYVMTGIAAKDKAGPSILISFIIAAILAAMVAACFTELASRIHKTGSTYQYVYITMGEYPAFLLGFCVITIITLSVAVNGRAGVSYIDSLFNGAIVNFTKTHIAEWDVGAPIAAYPDFLASLIILIFTVVVALGAQCSVKVNMVFSVINILVLLLVTIVGFIYADINNWTSPELGGFFPYGAGGVITGSASCFWAVTGFEQLAVAVEEIDNPRRKIPIAMTICLVTVLLLYLGSSSALTLMVPYYLIDRDAPFPVAFQTRGITWAQYVVAIGPVMGLTTAIINGLYAFGRFVYIISEDGLLFSACGRVSDRTHVPSLTILVGGTLMATIAIFFDIEGLLEFSVNIYLIQYGVIGLVVIYLRYIPDAVQSEHCDASDNEYQVAETEFSPDMHSADYRLFSAPPSESDWRIDDDDRKPLLTSRNLGYNSTTSRNQVDPSAKGGDVKALCSFFGPLCATLPEGLWIKLCLVLIAVLGLLLPVTVFNGWNELKTGEWWMILIVAVLALLLILICSTFGIFHQNIDYNGFKIPFVPPLPVITVVFCMCLLVVNSSMKNWIITVVLFAMCSIFYFVYGIHKSKLKA